MATPLQPEVQGESWEIVWNKIVEQNDVYENPNKTLIVLQGFIENLLTKEREKNFKEFLLLDKGAKDFVKRFGSVIKKMSEE